MLSVLMCLKPDERADYLAQALDSLKHQTRPADEIVLVQDGPASAELLEIIERYRGDLVICDHVLSSNAGLGAALNFGLQQCRGSLVARCDTDDVSLPDRFAAQIRAFEADPDLDILSGYAIEVDADGRAGDLRMVPLAHEQVLKTLTANPVVHPAVMFRREAILAAGSYGQDLRRAQDYELWFRCAAIGLRFGNLPQALVRYRFTPDDVRKRTRMHYWQQGRIGFAGARALRLSVWSQVTCFVPFFRSLLPRSLQASAFRIMRRFDPRHRD